MNAILMTIAVLVVPVLVILAIMYIGVPIFKGIGAAIGGVFRFIGWFIAHVFRFVGSMLRDSVRAVGAIIATVAFVPLVLLNIVIGRWSASAHFGRAVRDEVATFGHCLYSVCIGHPLRFLLLDGLLEGIEKRVPEVVANAPGSDTPSKRTGAFEGYAIVGSLKTGGSGGKLYVAEPDETKLASFERSGVTGVDQVVIKSFSVRDGSSVPQIVRESRALEAARKLGLVIEHEMTDERFFYVMKYVPGDDLTTMTRRLHSPTGTLGLTTGSLREATGYIADLLETLEKFHSGGLWHKDVKPDNIIVHDGEAHLVDLGLITPLYSGMTLTTHGTEYFRDPELVRMALRGAKVHEVDGVKFDVYGAGAVLYSVVENSFPAHGGLSQITKRCPEAVRWIVRRSMTDLNKRYPSAKAMLADLRVVQRAEDPFALRPADLPSMRGEPVDGFVGYDEADREEAKAPEATPEQREWREAAEVAQAEPVSPARGTPASFEDDASRRGPRTTPKIRVTDWLSGKYVAQGVKEVTTPRGRRDDDDSESVYMFGLGVGKPPFRARQPVPPAEAAHGRAPRARLVPAELRAPAKEQIKSARARAQAAQKRASHRHRTNRNRVNGRYSNEPNTGVVAAALFFFLGAAVLIGGAVVGGSLLMPAFNKNEKAIFPNATTVDFGGGRTFTADSPEDVTRRGTARTIASSEGGRTYSVTSEGTLFSAMLERLDGAGEKPVLVVSEYGKNSDEPGVDTLMALAGELVKAGHTVHGLNGSEEDLEFIARAKAAIGLSVPGGEQARDKLERWLASEGTPVSAVLWAIPEEDWQFVTPGREETLRTGGRPPWGDPRAYAEYFRSPENLERFKDLDHEAMLRHLDGMTISIGPGAEMRFETRATSSTSTSAKTEIR